MELDKLRDEIKDVLLRLVGDDSILYESATQEIIALVMDTEIPGKKVVHTNKEIQGCQNCFYDKNPNIKCPDIDSRHACFILITRSAKIADMFKEVEG